MTIITRAAPWLTILLLAALTALALTGHHPGHPAATTHFHN